MAIEEKRDRLETVVGVRVFSDIVEEAKANVEDARLEYENFSHYVRAALIRLNRYHREHPPGGEL